MTELARRIADNPRFQHVILGVIVLGAIVIGVETSATLAARYGALIVAVEMLIQAIFVAEIAIRVLAYWPRPAAFFRNGWNVFDFAVVAASLLPQAGAFAMVARLGRLIRVTRLVSAFPELRLIIGTMIRSIPSMGHVIVLLSLLLYVYAVLGFHFFREVDPGALGLARRGAADVVPDADAGGLGRDPGRGAGPLPAGVDLFQQLRVRRRLRCRQPVHRRGHQQSRIGEARATGRRGPRERGPWPSRGH